MAQKRQAQPSVTPHPTLAAHLAQGSSPDLAHQVSCFIKSMYLNLCYRKKTTKTKDSSAEGHRLNGQDKISLQVQGAPGWQHPSLPAGTHSTVSPPLEKGFECQCSSPQTKFKRQNSFLRGHKYPCRVCMHTKATALFQHSHKHQSSAAKADLQAAGADSACQRGIAGSW